MEGRTAVTHREFLLFIVLPILGVPAYFLLLAVLPEASAEAFVSENGPVELGTAVFYVLAAAAAIRHCRRFRAGVLRRYRVMFWMFAATALFVALEELSYGQHLLGFESPDWFEEHNKQTEMNLHNLFGSKPSSLMRNAASVALPVFCIALPIWYRWGRPRRQSEPASRGQSANERHWSFYLLPGLQLAALIIVAQAATLPRRIPDSPFCGAWIERLGELKELYWSIAAYLYVAILTRRMLRAASRDGTDRARLLRFPRLESLPVAERRAA